MKKGGEAIGHMRNHRIFIVVASVFLIAIGLFVWRGTATSPPAPQEPTAERRVVARGRIEPKERVRVIQGVSGAILQTVFVREGDKVAVGAVLAETDRRASRLADVAFEERRLEETERQLLQTTAPAKRADMEAQRALVRQRSAELQQFQRDLARASTLAARNVVSAEAEETKRVAVEKAEHARQQAESSWRGLTETRDVDVMVAVARVEVQKAALARARAELDLTQIRAPLEGEILMLMAREGEALGADGLLQMADMTRLQVVAEVDESDIGRVMVGQKATISGPVLAAPIGGNVVRLSKNVFKQKRPTSDILIGRDARIVEVDILPDSDLPPVVGGEVTIVITRSP